MQTYPLRFDATGDGGFVMRKTLTKSPHRGTVLLMKTPKQVAQALEIDPMDLDDTEYVLVGLIAYLTSYKEGLIKQTDNQVIKNILSGSVMANKRKITRIIEMLKQWKEEIRNG